MSSTAIGVSSSQSPSGEYVKLGRSFINPLFDYLLIGGGLSLLFGIFLYLGRQAQGAGFLAVTPAVFILLSNSAHFAASTVRLYTKPGVYRALPFITMGFPLITLAVLTLSLSFPAHIGRHINSLYLTWSPYHYAAQAFGLAVMYCYRSGCNLSITDKRLMRAVCMAPFLFAFMRGSNSGLGWFITPEMAASVPGLKFLIYVLAKILAWLSFLLPVVLFIRMRASSGVTMPAISMLLMLTNGIWWIMFSYVDAFVWATVFHGIQYIAITTIFHVKDHTTEPGNWIPWWGHTLWFYGVCLLLGYLLFNVLPWGYNRLGYELSESMLLCAAIINLHHFIVDGYIWKQRKDPNYKIITEGSPI